MWTCPHAGGVWMCPRGGGHCWEAHGNVQCDREPVAPARPAQLLRIHHPRVRVAERRGQPQRAPVIAWGISASLRVLFWALQVYSSPRDPPLPFPSGLGSVGGLGAGTGGSRVLPSRVPQLSHQPAFCRAVGYLLVCSQLLPASGSQAPQAAPGGFRRLVLAPWDMDHCLPYVVPLPSQ